MEDAQLLQLLFCVQKNNIKCDLRHNPLATLGDVHPVLNIEIRDLNKFRNMNHISRYGPVLRIEKDNRIGIFELDDNVFVEKVQITWQNGEFGI